MNRTQIYLDDAQRGALERRARASGRTKSALIREAIDDYLAEAPGEGPALRRLRDAVEEATGVAPYLEPGDEYVSAERERESARVRDLEGRRRR